MKRITLEVLTTKWCKLIRVVIQTHRGQDFGITDGRYVAKKLTIS